jgi:hypothetical protein
MSAKPRTGPPEQQGQAFELVLKGAGREVPAFYANAIQVLVSVYDVTLIIGQVGFGQDGKPEMKEVAKLNLSPQHAKMLDILAARSG